MVLACLMQKRKIFGTLQVLYEQPKKNSIFEASANTEKVDFENPREPCAFSKGKAQDSRNAPGELGQGPSTPRILEVCRRESRSEINFRGFSEDRKRKIEKNAIISCF